MDRIKGILLAVVVCVSAGGCSTAGHRNTKSEFKVEKISIVSADEPANISGMVERKLVEVAKDHWVLVDTSAYTSRIASQEYTNVLLILRRNDSGSPNTHMALLVK